MKHLNFLSVSITVLLISTSTTVDANPDRRSEDNIEAHKGKAVKIMARDIGTVKPFIFHVENTVFKADLEKLEKEATRHCRHYIAPMSASTLAGRGRVKHCIQISVNGVADTLALEKNRYENRLIQTAKVTGSAVN